MSWTGKTVVVAGGSAGLGLQIANAFASHGADTLILGRDPERLEKAAASSPAGRIFPFAADATDPEQLQEAAAEAASRFGRLDVWVNSVGVSSRGRAIETTPDQFRAALETNFLTAVHGAQAAAPLLRDSSGSLVFIGSLAAKTASPFLATYPASKFAVAAYAHQLRLELQEDGVHVLLACPGPLQRDDAGQRYESESDSVPEGARRPGGGARVKALDPAQVAERIVDACRTRRAELVMPAKAKWLFALNQISPAWGDWFIRRNTDTQ